MTKNELNRARYIENVSSKPFSLPSPTITFGRVQSVELDDRSTFGVITYGPIDKNIPNLDIRSYPRAYPLKSSLRHYPVVGEIVMLLQAPAFEAAIDNSKTQKRTYYSDIVSIWNEINHNAWIDTDQDGEVDLNERNKSNDVLNFEEDENVQPLKPGQGDIILQGRQGQSILFSNRATKQIQNNRKGSLKDPILILANGQFKSDDQAWHELDINKDPSSIYFVSNHKVNLRPDEFYVGITKVDKSDNYIGNQILVNTGRFIINSKKNKDIQGSGDLLFTLGSTASIQAGDSVEILGKNRAILNADKIYIGEKATQETSPVVLGDKLLEVFDTLSTVLKSMSTVFQTATTAAPGAPIPLLVSEGQFLKQAVNKLEKQLSKINSKKTYTE